MPSTRDISFAFAFALLAAPACTARRTDDGSVSGGGGQAAAQTVGSTTAAGAGGDEPVGSCAILDGDCSVEEQKKPDACDCADCRHTALCNPGQCEPDGACTLQDSCTCSDCATDPYCQQCEDDGACYPFGESCACADCKADPACAGEAG